MLHFNINKDIVMPINVLKVPNILIPGDNRLFNELNLLKHLFQKKTIDISQKKIKSAY